MNRHTDDQLYTADCPECQAALTSAELDADLDKIWAGIALRLWPTPVGRVGRLVGRLPSSRMLARILTMPRGGLLRVRLALRTVQGDERHQAAPRRGAGGNNFGMTDSKLN